MPEGDESQVSHGVTCESCEKEGVQQIQTENESGWFCEDHWMMAMMLGGKPGGRR